MMTSTATLPSAQASCVSGLIQLAHPERIPAPSLDLSCRHRATALPADPCLDELKCQVSLSGLDDQIWTTLTNDLCSTMLPKDELPVLSVHRVGWTSARPRLRPSDPCGTGLEEEVEIERDLRIDGRTEGPAPHINRSLYVTCPRLQARSCTHMLELCRGHGVRTGLPRPCSMGRARPDVTSRWRPACGRATSTSLSGRSTWS